MKIRVQNSIMSMKMVQAMGGSPTPIPWGELYTALDQGVVDGAENNSPSFRTSRHYEVCPYYSLDEHTLPARYPDHQHEGLESSVARAAANPPGGGR